MNVNGWLESLSPKVHLFAQEGRYSEPSEQGGDHESTSVVNAGELRDSDVKNGNRQLYGVDFKQTLILHFVPQKCCTHPPRF